MKRVLLFVFLILSVKMNAQLPIPLNKGNKWISKSTSVYTPNSIKYSQIIMDSTVIINHRTYFVLEKEYPGGSLLYQYLRYDSTDHFYKMYDSINTDNGNGEEYYYYKKGLKINDYWIQKQKFTGKTLYYSVIDTVQTIIFGKQSTIKRISMTDKALIHETQYWSDDFGLIEHGYEGGVDYLSGCIIDGELYGDTTFFPTGIDEQHKSQPNEFVLYQNYPNPYNVSTKIRYYLPYTCDVILKVYDVLGHEVAILVNGNNNKGFHEVSFDAAMLTSGLYIYRLEAGKFSQTKKFLLLK